MAKPDKMAGFGKVAVALVVSAGIAIALPSAGFALGSKDGAAAFGATEFATFTPATVDPALAQRVAASVRAKGLDFSFTPASNVGGREKTITVAVRVDDQTARAISVRSAISSVQSQQASARSVTVAPTRYNLGVARGYQGFAKAQADLPAGIRSDSLGNVAMPDLAEFKPAEGLRSEPSRFKSRIALEQDKKLGSAPRTYEGLGGQTLDLGGAYSVTKNLDVTAGLRLSQERDRLAPLTDNVQDSQAVYVGTQFRF